MIYHNLFSGRYHNFRLIRAWDRLIDWKKRRAGENGWLINQLRKHSTLRIFDAALGSGCDSIYLIKEGFEITSNEFDPRFLLTAQANAKLHNVVLRITNFDWCDINLSAELFDAVIILGNSLTHLFTEADQLQALSQFKRILKPGGILIIDKRNYQYILDNKNQILAGDFHYSGKYVYCGTVHARPVEISNEAVKFEYVDEQGRILGYLTFYPSKQGELKQLLQKAGFRLIQEYSDYQPVFNPNADFYQYVCVK